jgi:hypothetical protein
VTKYIIAMHSTPIHEVDCGSIFVTDGTLHELDIKTPAVEISTESPSECHYPSHLCDNGTVCLPVDSLCDGKAHCVDGFDEGLRCGKEFC